MDQQKTENNETSQLLIEIAWEVCNQVGGIYTVIRSKIPAAQATWPGEYLLLGPAVHPDRSAELDPIEEDDTMVGRVVSSMRKQGYDIFYGRWLVTGRPKVVLFNPNQQLPITDTYRKKLISTHHINIYMDHDLLSQVIGFTSVMNVFFEELEQQNSKAARTIVAHFHEWMAALPILDIRENSMNIKTVFTTHATMLGRYLAMNDTKFYAKLDSYDWQKEAQYFHIEPMVQIERACARDANTFTTVSEVTGKECQHLLGKKPDHIVPNGLNIERFVANHEVQNLHQKYKDEIHQFILGHFFHSYSFDLDKTLYFFTSGRYEYHNKGYDLTLVALKILNEWMKRDGIDITVVMFFITKRPAWSINPEVLENKGIMEEIRQNCEAIQQQMGERLFMAATGSNDDFKLPDMNTMVDDYWRLRYRRTLQSWKTDKWPFIVTHNLKDDQNDDILNFLRSEKLINSPLDKVKVVYHPDFINSTNPLFGIDYGDFVRGCHLGIFPSYYEPWGYTPLECIARGVPTITSDLSGFGDYVKNNFKISFRHGVSVLDRDNKSFDAAAHDLAKTMFTFVKSSRRYRISQRNKSEDLSERFDWHQLIQEYMHSYDLALKRSN